MKKLFILVLTPLFIYAGNAGAQSMLKVRLRDNSQQITVAVDGRYFNKIGTSITVGDLPYGNHNIKVYAITYNHRGRPKENLIYDASVKTYNGMLSTLIYDPESGRQDVQESDMGSYANGRGLPPQQQQPQFGLNGTGNGRAYDNNGNQSGYNNGQEQGNQQDNNMSQNDNSGNGGPVASPIASGSLTVDKLAALKKKVSDKSTDTQKLTAIEDGLKGEQINTAQVADMMDWFTFEASKVEFAKWAYKITVDNEYYSDLENKFSYKTSQDELDKFIKDAHH